MKSLKTRWPKPEDDTPDPQALESTAVGLLARREHSRLELQRKLTLRGYTLTDIEPLLDRLTAQNLQSDTRYTESYVRMRSHGGYGAQRIQGELRERGIPPALIEHELALLAETDSGRIDDVWCRKFKGQYPQDYRERAKQMRFLQQRGFSTDEIRQLYGRLGGTED